MKSMLNVGDRVVYLGSREAVVVSVSELWSYIIKFDDGDGWPDRILVPAGADHLLGLTNLLWIHPPRFGEGCWFASGESLELIQRGFEYDMDA